MALSVILTHPDGSPAYSIMVDFLEHGLIRLPTQVAFPGGLEEGEFPEIFYLDLGMMTEQITVRGTIDAITTPTKANLRDAAALWYKESLEESPTYIKLTVGTGESYYGGFKTMEFRQEAAKEDRWNFSFMFLVKEKV